MDLYLAKTLWGFSRLTETQLHPLCSSAVKEQRSPAAGMSAAEQPIGRSRSGCH